MSEESREMTLKEWCSRLPESHLVNKELQSYESRIKELEEEVKRAKDPIHWIAMGEYKALSDIAEKMAEALKDIEAHTIPPFAKIDPRTDNLNWLNYCNHVAKEALPKVKKMFE